jgi:sialic acid synthase SpsE
VSQYPADPKDFNLASLVELAAKFDVLSGLSDHSSGHVVPVVATTLGARLIEKHLVLDRNDGSIDAGFSMEPHEFRDMVDAVHSAHASLGERRIGLKDGNDPSRRFRRSILVSSSIRKGEELTPENLRIARPSDGLSPARWDEVLGKAAACAMEPGHPLALGDWVE